jgi:hypothetical protein
MPAAKNNIKKKRQKNRKWSFMLAENQFFGGKIGKQT